MKYRKNKYGENLSLLGYGCMRFSRKNGKIDLEKTETEIMEAYRQGVNYFDTAYLYVGSEEALGYILEKNGIRDKVNIATKLPQFLITKKSAIDKYFSTELQRLRTTYVDYYLMHHLTDFAMWEKLKDMGIIEWISEKKKSGEIRNIGFSYHGSSDGFLKILNDYDWDMCQIQYNYIDEVSQAGVIGLKTAAEKGIPVVIMEPLRGGKLVNMIPQKAKKIMEKSERQWTPAEWAFRWLFNQGEVSVVLSGMNSIEMVQENCKTASSSRIGDFKDSDYETIAEVSRIIKENEKVGCTGCRYCMPCPKGVDIPGIFAGYNMMYMESKWEGRKQFGQTVCLTKDTIYATQCVGCGKCEAHCPQGIKIREKLKEADKALRPLPVKIAIGILRSFMLRKTKREEKKNGETKEN